MIDRRETEENTHTCRRKAHFYLTLNLCINQYITIYCLPTKTVPMFYLQV